MPDDGLNEADLVQNAALGSLLVWNFGSNFQQKSVSANPNLLLSFIVLPICLHAQTLREVLGTRRSSGLSLFAEKIAVSRENLWALQPRALAMRDLTFQSIGFGVSSEILFLDYETAAFRSNEIEKLPDLPERIRPLFEAAGKLGYWCGSLSIGHTATLLKMDF